MNSVNRISKLSVEMCFLVLSTSAYALDGVDVEITADYNGKYVWRGQNLDDDPVFQPGMSATYGGLTFGIWGSMETTSFTGNSGEFTEVDEYVDYSASVPGIDILGFSVGLIYYDFPGTTIPRTAEAYWGLSLDVPLNPSITFNHDIDEADGLYISAGIGQSFELFEIGEDSSVSVDLGASFGWGDNSYNDYYWGVNKSKANDLALSASFPIDLNGWCITPSINYVSLVNSDIKNTNMYNTDNSEFFVGIGLSKGF
ncbi:MAG: MipA/OmpV family protein [Sedimentisphaerales bacterium]|nr:MipA/OmpV family protein [Sedimentisphaerales bacterium]